MDLTPYITSLREDLTTTASAGDEQTRRTAALLSGQVDFVLDPAPQDVRKLEESKGVKVVRGQENRVVFFGFDPSSGRPSFRCSAGTAIAPSSATHASETTKGRFVIIVAQRTLIGVRSLRGPGR